MSRRKRLWRRASLVVLLLFLVPLITSCDEPDSINEAYEECIDFASENADEWYDKCKDRAEDILDACLDAADDDEELERACRRQYVKDLQECRATERKIEDRKRELCEVYFNDPQFRADWAAGEKRREKAKEKAMEGLKGVAEAIGKLVKVAVDKQIHHRVERAAVNTLATALIPPGSTVAMMVTGYAEGIPDPLTPTAITFFFEPELHPNEVYVDMITSTHAMTLSGAMTLLFTPLAPDPTAPQEISFLDMDLWIGPMDFVSMSTRMQHATLNDYLPGQGLYDPNSSFVGLLATVALTNNFIPSDTLFLDIDLSGTLSETVPGSSLLQLSMTGPFTSIFVLEEPAPPISAAMAIGPVGGGFTLDGVSGIEVPSGTLTATTVISFGLFPPALLPDRCALPSEAGDPIPSMRCIAVAYETGPEGLSLTTPATLTIGYNPGLFSYMDIAAIKAYAYDAASGSWTPLPSFTHDMNAEMVYFPIDHFSLYGLGGAQQFQLFLPLVPRNY